MHGAGGAPAGGDGLDGGPGPHGGGVAAGEHRRAARHHRVRVDGDLALLDGHAVGAAQEIVDQCLADREDHRVGLDLDELALDGHRRTPAALVGLAQRAALEAHAAGHAVGAEDLDRHERVLNVDPLLASLLELLARSGQRALVLDAGEMDRLRAAAKGRASGVEGHVAAADDDDALARRGALAQSLLAQELDGPHDALLLEARQGQLLARLQAGGQEDRLVAVGQQ